MASIDIDSIKRLLELILRNHWYCSNETASYPSNNVKNKYRTKYSEMDLQSNNFNESEIVLFRYLKRIDMDSLLEGQPIHQEATRLMLDHTTRQMKKREAAKHCKIKKQQKQKQKQKQKNVHQTIERASTKAQNSNSSLKGESYPGNHREAVIQIFEANTMHRGSQKGESYDDLDSKRANRKLFTVDSIGKSVWTFGFYELSTDDHHQLAQLFENDWKVNCKEYVQTKHNTFVTVIMDGLRVWRAAILFGIYQAQPQAIAKDSNAMIQLHLVGVHPNFRRQKVGTVLLNYTVSMINEVMRNSTYKQYDIIAFVAENEFEARSFWHKNEFKPTQFDRDMLNKNACGVSRENAFPMLYVGDKTKMKNEVVEVVNSFETPKYVKINKKNDNSNEDLEEEKEVEPLFVLTDDEEDEEEKEGDIMRSVIVDQSNISNSNAKPLFGPKDDAADPMYSFIENKKSVRHRNGPHTWHVTTTPTVCDACEMTTNRNVCVECGRQECAACQTVY
eukprot:177123_1